MLTPYCFVDARNGRPPAVMRFSRARVFISGAFISGVFISGVFISGARLPS